MHASALRNVLFIRAIEECDPAGDLLPLADRSEATRSVARGEITARAAAEDGHLSRAAASFLAERAALLRERMLARSPIVSDVLTLAGGASKAGRVLLLLALVSGVSLSALDGSRRIDILAFPLIGLIAWNLLVYAGLIVSCLRAREAVSGAPAVTGLYERWIRWRTEGLLRRSSQFNAPLATALRRFANDWSPIGRPLMVLRAKRLLHLSAALVPLGLIAGLYVRGIVLRYEAGWESTFLSLSGARTLVTLLYAPASAITGVSLPATDAQMQALEWTGSAGGGPAAAWIHLIAATAAIYIVVPRLLAALLTTMRLWRATSRPEVPAYLSRYARALLAQTGDVAPEKVVVAPYAYDPDPQSLSGVQKLLADALGCPVHLELREVLRYGEEDSLREWLSREEPGDAQFHVLLFDLAATPEAENHGAVIMAFRDWVSRLPGTHRLLVVVDETQYASRMERDPSLQSRLEQRRELWRDFVRRHGVGGGVVNLGRFAVDPASESRASEALRVALEFAR